ncbi:MAG: ABC transporter permease [Rhodobacteraceae bacterium]|nr:ABC transporter permease [Paracoccaceae bacterium]
MKISDFARRDPLGFLGLLLVALVIFCGLFGAWLAPYSPSKIDIPARLMSPTWDHVFGTDKLGRDVFSRVLHGSALALKIGVVSVGLSVILGIFFGLLSGYGPRWLDNLLLLIFDSTYSFPTVILGLTLVTLFGASNTTLMALVIIFLTPAYARLVRTSTLSAKSADYILAIRSLGASSARILGIHILPNVIGPIIVVACMDVPGIIALEAGLTYLGLGVPPPAPSWGRILEEGTGSIREAPWIVLAGGLPIIIATLGFTFLGESMRERLDPKRKGRT